MLSHNCLRPGRCGVGWDAVQPKFLCDLTFLRARPIAATAGSPPLRLGLAQPPEKRLYKSHRDETSGLGRKHHGKCRRLGQQRKDKKRSIFAYFESVQMYPYRM